MGRTALMAVVGIGCAAGTPAQGLCPGASAPMTRAWRVQDGGNGHLYNVVIAPDGISWSDARRAADLLGGHLATPTTLEENAFIYSMIVGIDEAWAACRTRDGRLVLLGPWIGATQASGAGEPGAGWSWITGETWSDPQWAPREPNNHGDAPRPEGENRVHYIGVRAFNDAGPGREQRRSPFWNDIAETPAGTAGEPGLRVTAFVVEFPARG